MCNFSKMHVFVSCVDEALLRENSNHRYKMFRIAFQPFFSALKLFNLSLPPPHTLIRTFKKYLWCLKPINQDSARVITFSLSLSLSFTHTDTHTYTQTQTNLQTHILVVHTFLQHSFDILTSTWLKQIEMKWMDGCGLEKKERKRDGEQAYEACKLLTRIFSAVCHEL